MNVVKQILVCCMTALCWTASAQTTVVPDGAMIQSVRNDDESALYIPGVAHYPLTIDDADNLHGVYWKFYFAGTVSSLSDIVDKPVCNAGKTGLRAGCGYVAHFSAGGQDVYVRMYVPEMLKNRNGEIIGATIVYQTPYESRQEKETQRKKLAEKKASGIFWDGTAVPDENLRRAILSVFDTDGDGMVSRTEAGRYVLRFELESVCSADGLEKLTGIENLCIDNLNNQGYAGHLNINLPYLGYFSYKGEAQGIDLSSCKSLKNASFTDINCGMLNLGGLQNLEWVSFKNSRHLNYVSTLDCRGCTGLLMVCGTYGLRGSRLNLEGCGKLAGLCGDDDAEFSGILPAYKKINLSGCHNLDEIQMYGNRYQDKDFVIEELDLSGCSSLRRFIVSADDALLKLPMLDLSSCAGLEDITIRGQKIGAIDVGGCDRIGSFILSGADVQSLDLSGKKHLKYVSADENKNLTRLNVSGCDSLSSLYCAYNALSMIDLNRCSNLVGLICNDNNLLFLDVSDFQNLELLNCSSNRDLSTLILGIHKSMSSVNCDGTSVISLDISGCSDEFTACENASKLTVPSYRDGFRILYVNRRQMVEDEPLPLCDKKFDKRSILLVGHWDRLSGDWVSEATDEDVKFKIKVSRLRQLD